MDEGGASGNSNSSSSSSSFSIERIFSSFHLGSISGIPVTVHYTFFLLFAFEIFSSVRLGLFSFFALVFILYGPILLCTVILHELGHALTTQKLGGEVTGIVLWPLGGYAMCGPTNCGAFGDLKVSIAGPLTHIPQGLLWFGVYHLMSGNDYTNFSRIINLNILSNGNLLTFFSVLSAQSFWLNVYLITFNLLIPAYPLDGGQIMISALILSGYGLSHTAWLTSVTAMVISGLMALWGLVNFVEHGHPNGLFTALVGFFIFSSSSRLYNLARTGRVREHPLFRSVDCEEQDGGGGSGGFGGAGGGVYVPLGSES